MKLVMVKPQARYAHG